MEALKIPTPTEIELKGENDNGDAADLVGKALDDLKGSFDAKLAEIEKKSIGRLDKIEARLNRPAAGNDDKPAGEIERKAFTSFVRRGVERMDVEEQKALTVASDASAGYLAPDGYGSEILKKLVEFSPIRQYARVVSIGVPSIKWPRRVSGPSATWTEESAPSTASTAVYEQVALTPYELRTFIDVSNALLEDNAYNLEDELAADLAEAFGTIEGAAFVVGDGDGKPKGIVNATGIAEVKTGAAGGFPETGYPSDLLIGMYHKLPSAYAQRGVWMMNRNTLAGVRKWKNGATGEYMVVDGLSGGMPMTLLGRPIVEMVDMPDVAANAFPIIFGDLQGYRIVDRVSFSLMRDPFTQADKGQVRLHARRRVGGDVTHPDRFVKLKVAA